MTPHAPPRHIMLDGVRGFAALTVLFFHLRIDGLDAFRRGYLMVDLFFMLSGFVMARAYEPKLRAGLTPLRFMIARYRRLLPVVWLGVAIGVASYVVLRDPNWGLRGWVVQIGLAMLLVPTIWITRDPALFPLNRPHWSLFFEIVANAVHAIVLWRLRDRAIGLLAFVFAALLAWSIKREGVNGAGAFQGVWYLGFLRVGFSYVAGIWLARRWTRLEPETTLWWPLILALLVAVLLSIETIPVWMGEIFAVMIAFPIIVWLAAAVHVPQESGKALTWLGAISYPLYATHGPILALFRELGGGVWPKVLAAGLSLAVAIVAALVLERARLRRNLGLEAGEAGSSGPD